MPKKPSSESYQSLRKQLEDAVSDLQNPDISIDDAIARYEAAMKLIGKLEEYLKTAENRVREIKERYAKDS